MITETELKKKLKKYIISRKAYPHIPSTLEGEILLEEVKDESGNILGWITVSPSNLVELINMRDDKSKRPDEIVPEGVIHQGKNLRDLSAEEFEEVSGYKKYFDRWRSEGIKI